MEGIKKRDKIKKLEDVWIPIIVDNYNDPYKEWAEAFFWVKSLVREIKK